MKSNETLLRPKPWAIALVLSAVTALAAIEVARLILEENHKGALAIEVKRRAMELMAVTLNGNVMGSAATIGLVNHPLKRVARGEVPLEDPAAMEVLRALGESYGASGVYVIQQSGVVRSNWYSIGQSLSGVDVKFRPYFQIAMQGRKNVYAAIGTTTGQRALYFAAPLHDSASSNSPVIGVSVIRTEVDRVDSVLKSWPGHALLLSPQKIAFASNRSEWIEQTNKAATPEQLASIRALRQFGNTFEKGTPKVLPFDITEETVSFDNRRYAVDRAPVQWNDQHGDWTLVLLGDLDALMPASKRAAIGATAGAMALLLSALFLAWRRRLDLAHLDRQRAEIELRGQTARLEADSKTKSFVAEVSADLHGADSVAAFARKFMFHVAPKVGADLGVFYVLDRASGLLDPAGGHGVLDTDLEKVAIGQGLVGQCASEKNVIAVSGAAQADLRIVWGQGESAPKSIVLFPVLQSGSLLGVVVLASLQVIDAGKRALLEVMMPMVAANLEILERNLDTKRQTGVLSEKEAFTRALMDSSPAGLLLGTREGEVRFVSARWTELFGYTKEDFSTMQAADLYVDPKDREPIVAAMERDGKVRDYEARFRHKNGMEMWHMLNSSLVTVGTEQLLATWFHDVSGQRQMTEQIRALAEEQELLLANLQVGLLVTGDGRIVSCNPRLCASLGYADEAALAGKPASALFASQEDYAAFGARVGPALREGRPVDLEWPFRRQDGEARWMHVAAKAIKAAGGNYRTVWILTDVPAKREAAAQGD